MLNVQSRRRGAAAGNAPHTSTLSVSWLGKTFRAVALHRGQVQARWEAPEPVEGTHHFADLLQRAVAATGYAGESVSLVLSHPRLAHQLVEVPPARGQELSRLLDRAAQQQSGPLFTTKAAWSAQPAESVKGTPRFLLNLFPKPLLDELLVGARKANLFLTAVLPPTAVLHNQLQELPAQENDVVMLAADTGGTTTVLVGHSDGRVLLARALPGNWNDALPALALDLRRTMLFVNQQHSVDVQALFLFGPNAAERAADLQAQVGLPTRPSPAEIGTDYWATEALRVHAALAQNFISREQQMAPQRRKFAWVVGAATGLAALACLAVAAQLHRMRSAELKNVAGLRSQATQLEVRHRELQEAQAEVARHRDLISLVATNRPPPVAALALGYLSEAVPAELVVTNFLVRQEERGWQFRLAGRAQPGATNALARVDEAVAALTNRLVAGPLRLRLNGTDQPPPPNAPGLANALAGIPAGWLAKLTGTPPVVSATGREFVIEGVIHP